MASNRSGTVFSKDWKDFTNAPTEGGLNLPTLYSAVDGSDTSGKGVIRIGEEETGIIVVFNKFLDANIQVMPQGSIDGENWADLLANDARFDYEALDPITNKPAAAMAVSDPWPFIRVRVQTIGDDYTYDTVPTDGTVVVQWASKRSRLNVV